MVVNIVGMGSTMCYCRVPRRWSVGRLVGQSVICARFNSWRGVDHHYISKGIRKPDTVGLAARGCVRIDFIVWSARRLCSDNGHAYYRLYAFVVPEYLADSWNQDRIMNELNDAGIPWFSGSSPEIYREKAFDQTDLRPQVSLANAHSLGRVSLAFLVHPALTSVDMDRTCEVLDKVLTKAAY